MKKTYYFSGDTMIIIISNQNFETLSFKNEQIIFLKNICEIKFIEEKHNIVFLLGKYLDADGAIDNKYLFEEILFTIPCDCVISNSVNKKLEEVCSFYEIPLFSIN